MLSIINENIADLYISQKDYELALEYYQKVKKFNEEIGDEILYAESANNIAVLYTEMGQLEYALFNVNSSIKVFEKNKLMGWLAYAYETKGKIYLKQENYEWALLWFKQSEMLFAEMDDVRGEIELVNGLSQAYLGLEDYTLSKEYALKAFALAGQIKKISGKQQSAKTLYQLSKQKGDHKGALEYHEIYQQLSDSLFNSDNKTGLTLLKTNMLHEKQKQELISENEIKLAKQRNYVNISLAALLLFITVLFLVKRNEKIHKKLNAELKVKTDGLVEQEKELKEINESKDKLFSIVAHDLRGPIGAFQGILNLFKEGDIGKDEFMDFIPKLGKDIDHISFTLNNLLSWGQNQMNGIVTKPEIISLDKLVTENINLLSETATNKSIKIESTLHRKTLAWSDGNQIDIVIRNLLSNAIKFTPSKGLITVSSKDKDDQWEISVNDTGIGMDKEAIDNIFCEKSNHTTYGTNNEKNNGKIWVESYLDRGTTFYFTLPKSKYDM